MKKMKRLKAFAKNRMISLATRIRIIVAGMLALVALAFALALVVLTLKTSWDYELSESETLLTGISGSISTSMETYKDISRLIMLNGSAIKFLRAKSVDIGMTNDTSYGVMDVLHASRNVDSVVLIRNDGNFMNSGRGGYKIDTELMGSEGWREPIINEKGGVTVEMNAKGAFFKNNGTQLITIQRAFNDIITQQPIGILLMNISDEMLKRIAKDRQDKVLCIMTKDGDYLAGNKDLIPYYNEKFLSENIVHQKEGAIFKETMISGCVVPETPLLILCKTDAREVTPAKELMLAVAAAFLIVAFSILLAGLLIGRHMTRPILKLARAIEKTKESGQLETIDVKLPRNEISVVKDSYNSAVEHYKRVFDRLLEKEKAEQNAQLRVLYEQIKPHFLYNSLETISYLAVEAGADQVQSALETLGSFYRNFLSKGSRVIPLKREISIIKDYLSLQRLRYGDIINDIYEIQENTEDIMIPKLLLQPLVENSINYGIRQTGEAGTIRISSYRDEINLHLIVYDTGIGMEQDYIEQILSDERKNLTEDMAQKSFGLRGTIERVRYYSDNRDAVQIRSVPGEYTEIEMIIPLFEGIQG